MKKVMINSLFSLFSLMSRQASDFIQLSSELCNLGKRPPRSQMRSWPLLRDTEARSGWSLKIVVQVLLYGSKTPKTLPVLTWNMHAMTELYNLDNKQFVN